MSKRRVVVIGGGVAGIVAALDCAQGGGEVTLLEVRPRLGGAAYSFKREGLLLDNGQHVFLRCCGAYIGLLERLGSRGRVCIQDRLEIPVLSPGGGRTRLRRGGLRAPLHLACALARYPHLGVVEKVAAARAAVALGKLGRAEALERERRDGTTFGEWLSEHGQGERAVAALWDLIALPTLNLPAARGSLVLGAFVLQTGLLQDSDAGDIGFHVRPLSEIVGGPAVEALERAGVRLRLGVRARRVERSGKGLRVCAEDGEVEGDAVVCAIPHMRAASLLAPLLGAETEPWKALGESPIVNVHVVYDRRVCDLGFAAGVGTPMQYVFDRTEAVGLAEGQCLAVSLSGAEREMAMEAQALRERHVEALREIFPRAREAVVRGVYVSREHAATFRAAPGCEALRPGARTSVEGIVLAGAWTATGWPATLEGAALSGGRAAREAMAA